MTSERAGLPSWNSTLTSKYNPMPMYTRQSPHFHHIHNKALIQLDGLPLFLNGAMLVDSCASIGTGQTIFSHGITWLTVRTQRIDETRLCIFLRRNTLLIKNGAFEQ